MEQWKRKAALIVLMGLIIFVAPVGLGRTAPKPGSAPGSGASFSGAAAVGTRVSAIVELSDMYRAPETYDVKITVLEILRGKPAGDLLTKSGISNTNVPAQNGFEPVLARVRFEYAARGAPGDKSWELTDSQFSVFSGDGKPYEASSMAPPDPKLSGVLRPGDSRQGWISFRVAIEDKKPVMNFVPGSIWLQLY